MTESKTPESDPTRTIPSPTAQDLELSKLSLLAQKHFTSRPGSRPQRPAATAGRRASMLVFCATVALSAFLLFQVQPLIGKFILPWFGSSPGVWTTCILFFQVVFLGGCAYAHLVVSRLPARAQGLMHLCVLGLTLLTLPITPSDAWKPAAGDAPVLGILLVLAGSVGLPFLALSSTGSLLQAWFVRVAPGRSPYRLYALSNVGSIVALVTYPFVVERFVPLRGQTTGWSGFYVLFAALCGICALTLLRHAPATEPVHQPERDASDAYRPTPAFDVLLWLLLSACGSALLLATTNQLVQDVAAVPLLWVLPLAVYLLTFILCFERERWYPRPLVCALLPLALFIAVQLLDGGVDVGMGDMVMGYSATLLVCCMCCHGELARLKPAPRQLTFFFLMVASGGALGGLFVVIVAPTIFAGIYEYHLLLAASLALTLVAASRSIHAGRAKESTRLGRMAAGVCWVACSASLLYGAKLYLVDAIWLGEDMSSRTEDGLRWLTWSRYVAAASVLGLLSVAHWFRVKRSVSLKTWWGSSRKLWLVAMVIPASLGLVSLAGILGWQVFVDADDHLRMDRNFYGVLSIDEYAKGEPEHDYTLFHGRIHHGYQFQRHPEWPTAYYGPDSGLGIALRHHPSRGVLGRQFRVGVVGLGTGTVAAYANASIEPERPEYALPLYRSPADYLRFYEINPMVRDWADEHFTFLGDARRRGADVEVFMGDARIAMERQLQDGQDQHFDVLAIDAFSGDAIPIHLLTVESLAIYRQHLRRDGILAIHVTNRFVELMPVVRRLAEEFDMGLVGVVNTEDEEHGVDESDWVLITNNRIFLEDDAVIGASTDMPPAGPLWTDDFSSIFDVLDID